MVTSSNSTTLLAGIIQLRMTLPNEVQTILTTLEQAGFEAFAVGGGVRDLLLGRTPKDWDVATSASPEEIQKVFPKSFYANPQPLSFARRGGLSRKSKSPRTALTQATAINDTPTACVIRAAWKRISHGGTSLSMLWHWPRLRQSFGGQGRRDLSIILF